MKNGIKSLAVWLIFLIIFIVLISSIMDNSSNKLAYSELLADMEKGTVTSIEIQDGGEKALVELEGDSVPKEVNIPDINSFMTYAQEILKTNSYTLTERPESVFMKGLYLIIPFGIIVIVLLFGLLLINPGNQGGNKTMSFGKSRARMTNGAEKTKVTFNDVAGVDEEKEELEEIVEFLKTPKKFTDTGYVYGEAEVQRQGGRIGVYTVKLMDENQRVLVTADFTYYRTGQAIDRQA